MNANRSVLAGLVGLACAMLTTTVVADGQHGQEKTSTGLVRAVRQATSAFRDVNAAIAAGYGSSGTCVSGPQEGAMGIHYPNGALVGDGALDAQHPEILIYELKNRRLRLLGVEFLVIAEDWHVAHADPPMLMGQHFHYVGSPNRYGLPAFYELHVWAWKDNPHGMFVDWNPNVSCEEFEGE
jgi:hypothetical protein